MSVVDEIKARLDVVDVISSYISLQKAGRNYKALCPFHSEKTPSFTVNPERQSWRCFGACNEGGDIFSFVMKIEGYDFKEALQVLAKRAGVELEEPSPQSKAKQEAEDRLRGLLAAAADFYHQLLLHDQRAGFARDYVFNQRGLKPETVDAFQLGFAPDGWDNTLKHFQAEGYTLEEMLAASLLTENDRGRVYDRFRNRFVIPIRDARGHTLGFGARALAKDDIPKYLNSSQGPLFDKSQLLYGLDMARRDIRETETVVVVEGYMDVIQAHQSGYRNVVAQMGTALTEAQVQQVARYAERLILALDTDAAGQQATMRGLDVVRESLAGAGEQTVVMEPQHMMRTAGKLSLDVRVLQLPDGKDPDDFVRAYPEQWPDVVAAAQPLIDYVIDVGTQDLSPAATIQERERVARQLLPLLTATENDLTRQTNVQQLARRLRIAEQTLLNWASRAQDVNRRRIAPAQPRPATSPQNMPNRPQRPQSDPGRATERYCIACLLQHPDWLLVANRRFRELAAQHKDVAELLAPINEQDFTQQAHRQLFELIEKASFAGATDTLDYGADVLSHELRDLAESILQAGHLEAFREGVSPLHWSIEIESIKREHQRFDSDQQEQQEFLNRIVDVRLDRILAEKKDRYFFTNAETDAASMNQHDALQVQRYTRARQVLEQAKK
jgi:DNA primase